MGFFGNIKKILFEDDEEEINSMPVYSDKEEIKESHVDKKEVVILVTAYSAQLRSNTLLQGVDDRI
jgi:hypothetical protein